MGSFEFRSGQVIFIGALLGALSVVTGAMGAHALKDVLVGDYQSFYDKAVFYQFVHSFLIIMIGMMADKVSNLKTPIILAVLGIVFFSGSLYLFSLQEVLDLGSFKKIIGPITPIGGLCFIGAWISFGIKVLRNQNS